ncbi:acetate kinase [Campylobacter hominis]|uniref:acetate kinase n=1 Tax=Campylobacter hominis TaxID=76517 RepID=UPI00248C1E69|nr:acetate kinase [Campylobacter hominis]
MKILVINSGSSSIKFKFYDLKIQKCLASGMIEQIGDEVSHSKIETCDGKTIEENMEIRTHDEGIVILNRYLKETGVLTDLKEIDGVGHRIVQGADYFEGPALVDDDVITKIEELIPLAPLHNPAHLSGIRSSLRHAPCLPNVVVFDNTFYHNIPDYAYMYALPYKFYEKYRVRKFGAHGISHEFVTKKGADFLGIDYKNFCVISLHIGSGSSISATKDGICIDTSMGLTPLEGLMMSTRCGSVDPAIIPYMKRVAGYLSEDIDTIMNKKSGLLGITGTSDFRKVLERMHKGDERAKLAFDMLTYQIVKIIGSYYAILPRVDAIIWTAGIGENSAELREAVSKRLAHLGVGVDETANVNCIKKPTDISSQNATIKTLVIPTDEEYSIAKATERILLSLKK